MSVAAAAGAERVRIEDSVKKVSRQSSSRANETELSQYHGFRRSLRQLLDSSYADSAISLVIIFNVVVIICETDAGATCRLEQQECSVTWLRVSNLALLFVYTVEALVRLYVFRLRIIHRTQDMADITILLLSYADAVISEVVEDSLPGVQMLRVFRISKVFRAARILRVFPELYVMLRGFLSAMSAMLWGCLLIMLLLVMWSITAVEFLQPISMRIFDEGSSCHTSFKSVFHVTLLFFQTLVAGDSWGNCSIGIIKDSPVTWVMFALSLVMIQIGLTNLILAVVVQKAAEAHEEDLENKVRHLAAERKRAERRLGSLCDQIDIDQDGVIGLKELEEFAKGSTEFKEVLESLDIHIDDLTHLFTLMDKDSSGDLTYDELVDCISRAHSNDIKRQVMMLKLQVSDVWSRVRGQIQGSMQNMEANIQVLREHVDAARSDWLVQAPPTYMEPLEEPDGYASTQHSGKLLQMPEGSSSINDEMDCIRQAVDRHLSRLAEDVQQRLGNGVRYASTQEATEGKLRESQDAGLLREQVGTLCRQILAVVATETGAPWYSSV